MGKGKKKNGGMSNASPLDTTVVRSRKLVTVGVPRGLQFFPDRLRAWCKTTSIVTQASSVGDSLTYKANGIGNLFGPRINYTGAFASNAPSGLLYLLSSSATGGAAGPYGRCLVLKCNHQMQITPTVSNTIPSVAFSCFNLNASQSGLILSAICEQPFTAVKDIPSQVTGSGPVILRNGVNMWDVLGVSEKVYMSEISDYAGTAAADPNTLVYLQTSVRAIDGVTTMNAFIMHTFEFEVLFDQRNPFIPTAPS